jgi:hypothetical protein
VHRVCSLAGVEGSLPFVGRSRAHRPSGERADQNRQRLAPNGSRVATPKAVS